MALIGPKKKPQDFVRPGETWFHLVVNDQMEACKAFSQDGKLLWNIPCLARGLYNNWRIPSGDTPPGLYKVGQIYRDLDKHGLFPAYCNRDMIAFGWYSFDLIDLENQETGNGRAGIMMHGGGSACGWPGAWNPLQRLHFTHGCIRLHNQDLRDKVLLLTEKGTVFVSVYQDQ